MIGTSELIIIGLLIVGMYSVIKFAVKVIKAFIEGYKESSAINKKR